MRREVDIKAGLSLLKIKQDLDVAESNLLTVKKAMTFSSTSSSYDSTTCDQFDRAPPSVVDSDIRSDHSSKATQRTVEFINDKIQRVNGQSPVMNNPASHTLEPHVSYRSSSGTYEPPVVNVLTSDPYDPHRSDRASSGTYRPPDKQFFIAYD
ncbi:hypothetical protein FSP39_004623 [Pinctada imbricata]|uniref:Uncharacterized protein n=1 Tax=Pinctada imbricata TaxID=66713 RepID=A0AA88YPW0_PINIB|nr:hypothetical protein FSP39_004623 [Pinctada imbricata]